MASKRYGPPPPKGKGLGKFGKMGMVILGSLPVFLAFQNFGSNRQAFRFNIPSVHEQMKVPEDLLTSDGRSLSQTLRPVPRSAISQRAWEIQAKDESRRAMRLLAAQISELFPKGQLSSEPLYRAFMSRDFIEITRADQMVAGDPIPVCQWLQTAYASFLKRVSTPRLCSSKTVDLELEVNPDCRFQAMIEQCNEIPPLPYPSLYDSWMLCGKTSCESQITKDLATYLQLYRITGDSTWIFNRFLPMSAQALRQTEGPFVLLPPLEFAKMVLEHPEMSKLKTADGASLEQKSLEYIIAFDRSWAKEFKDIHNLKSDLYRPTIINVSRFHALLKRSQIQRMMEDPAAKENARTVRQFARELKNEVFTRKNLRLGQIPEVYAFIQEASNSGLEFSAEDLGQLKSSYNKTLKSGPWRIQPRAFALLLSSFVSE